MIHIRVCTKYLATNIWKYIVQCSTAKATSFTYVSKTKSPSLNKWSKKIFRKIPNLNLPAWSTDPCQCNICRFQKSFVENRRRILERFDSGLSRGWSWSYPGPWGCRSRYCIGSWWSRTAPSSTWSWVTRKILRRFLGRATDDAGSMILYYFWGKQQANLHGVM